MFFLVLSLSSSEFVRCQQMFRIHTYMHACIHTHTHTQESALKHCHRVLNPYFSVFAFIEAYGTRDAVITYEPDLLDKCHKRAEQLAKWQLALSRLSAIEQEVGTFRIKGRRIKTYMQEKLQVPHFFYLGVLGHTHTHTHTHAYICTRTHMYIFIRTYI